MKLIDQWNELQLILEQKEEDYLTEFFKENVKPTELFRLYGWVIGIIQIEVVKFRTREKMKKRPWIDKIAKKTDVAELKRFIDAYIPNEVLVEYKFTTDGKYTSTSAVSYDEIGVGDKPNISFNKELLEPILAEMMAKYAPRENHFACSYCMKQTPNEQKVTSNIIGRGRKKVWNSWKNRYEDKACVTTTSLEFCSGVCAGNEQMSREG
jgi:hypothetical protein